MARISITFWPAVAISCACCIPGKPISSRNNGGCARRRTNWRRPRSRGSCSVVRLAVAARATSLRILCDQLEHTQANLKQLENEIDKLLQTDAGAKGLQSVPDFGRKTVAVLRAELGDVTRFQRTDQVVAYAGLDIE